MMKVMTAWFCFLMVISINSINCQSKPTDKSDIKGQWDMVVQKDGKELPSWLEIYKFINLVARHLLEDLFMLLEVLDLSAK